MRNIVYKHTWYAAMLIIIGATVVACASPNTVAQASYTAHIMRSPGFSSLLPLDQTYTQSAPIQQLYQDILAMPVYSVTGIHSCPLDDNIQYSFAIFAHGVEVLDATADGSGCKILKRANISYQTDSTFWDLVQQIVSVPTPAT